MIKEFPGNRIVKTKFLTGITSPALPFRLVIPDKNRMRSTHRVTRGRKPGCPEDGTGVGTQYMPVFLLSLAPPVPDRPTMCSP